jgi:hypothetical protein
VIRCARITASVLISSATVLGSGCAGAPTKSLPSRAKGTRRGHTEVLLVQPTSASGRLKSGYKVVSVVSGECHGGSRVVAGEVYSCDLHNPCWSSANRRVAYCLESPWLHEIFEVRVSRPLPPDHEVRSEPPWGVELTSDKRCEATRGMGESYRGQTIRFRCSDYVGLIGEPVRSGRYWSIREAIYSPSSEAYRYGRKDEVETVWYGLANGSVRRLW